jgi:hypothetical protein
MSEFEERLNLLLFLLQGEFSTQLKALDAELGLAVPITPRADICFKSSATPVRNVFELPVPVDAPGAHVTYR